ncbi:MAG: hypothetical protein SFV19_09100 [Rhodospirillaceae bacterium]|nr:hypothetical protein [Rhodospirillaceae bacterium]
MNVLRLARRALVVAVSCVLMSAAARADCTIADVPSAGVTGFQEAVISVADMDAALAVWRDVGAYEVICQGPAAAGAAAFWGVPANTRIDEVVLRKPGKTRGFIRLVKFHGLPQVQIRSSGMSWDTGGIFDLYMYVDELQPVFEKLRALGWQSYNDPVTYTLGPFTVAEVMMRGPNGEVLCLMQRDAPAYDKSQFGLVDGSKKGFGWPFNAALVSADFAPGEKLFGEILGWKVHLSGDSKSQPPGDNPLGLPKNLAQTTSRKFAAYAPHPTDRNGSIQVLANVGIDGRDFSARAKAPNLGILTLRVPIDDLAAFEKDFTAKGGQIADARRTLTLAPYGPVDILSVIAPNGARIEFFSQK